MRRGGEATRQEAARRQAEGEAEGLRLGMEHLQDAATQARREAEEAREKAAAAAQRKREEADAALALVRLLDRAIWRAYARRRGRGWLARLRNRRP